VKGIDRAKIAGSFTISVFANIGGTSTYVGTEAVLSRWHPTTCSNCQQHLIVGAQFPLAAVAQMELAPQEELANTENYDVVLQTRSLPTQDGVDEEGPRGLEPQRTIDYQIEII
jgi:tyrosinase